MWLNIEFRVEIKEDIGNYIIKIIIMKRELVLKSLCDEYKIRNDNAIILADFSKKNKDL